MEEKLYGILKKHKLPLKKREEMMVDLLNLFSVTNSLKNGLNIGQVWHDKNHAWTDGSTTLDMIHLILSADMEDGKYYWKTACFTWCGEQYKGARIRKLLEKEVRLMECVGTIESIISF